MEASFGIQAFSKPWLLKYQRLYNTEDSEEVKDSEDQEEQEVEEDLFTTCAVVYKLIFDLPFWIFINNFNNWIIVWYIKKIKSYFDISFLKKL